MKKITITLALASITIISTSAFVRLSQNGIQGYTGSPGENSCNLSGCHGGGTSSAAGTTITAVPSFTADEFVPGTNYTITIDFAAAGFNKYGFGCEILGANNANAGTMQNAGAGVKFLNAGQRKNAVHTTPKTGTGGASFSFEWAAPSVGDTATIYVAGNAVNGNGSTSGDFPLPRFLMQLKAHVEPGPDPDPNAISENKSNVISGVSVFPNPASGLTSITYFLSQTQNVMVQLVDINGKVVKEFINETQTPGSHAHLLELKNITPGIYFVKTSTNNQKVSQKLIAVQ